MRTDAEIDVLSDLLDQARAECDTLRAELDRLRAAHSEDMEVLRHQLAGAVGTLVRIATRDYDPLQHESPGSLAREALAAMGDDRLGGQ